MQVTEVIKQAVSDVTGTDIATIQPSGHIFNDYNVDSLGFLDVIYDVETGLKVKLPMEAWLAEREKQNIPNKEFFLLSNFISFVERTLASSKAPA
jgi:acyl carrier protein